MCHPARGSLTLRYFAFDKEDKKRDKQNNSLFEALHKKFYARLSSFQPRETISKKKNSHYLKFS